MPPEPMEILDTDSVPASPALRRLATELAHEQPRALERFWRRAEQHGTPLLEHDERGRLLATFLWRALPEAGEVRLLWPSRDVNTRRFDHLPRSDVHYLSLRVPSGLRASYRIASGLPPLDDVERGVLRQTVRDAAHADPLNRHTDRQVPLEGHSLVELPGAPPQPWLRPRDGVPSGRVESVVFESRRLGNRRTLALYTPPGFTAEHPGYPLLLVFDGQAYQEQVPTPVILDNLIAEGRIPPLVAVLVDNVDRDSRAVELPCNPDVGDMLGEELLPWLMHRLPLSDDPGQRILAGSSYGGLAAACYTYQAPQRFGMALVQSGSFWWGPDGQPQWLLERFRESPRLPIRFYMDAGLLEGASPDILGSSRQLAAILHEKGYQVAYREFVGGHDYAMWRGTLADGLQVLLGPESR
ncbi:enterochelin esterase [Vreelandella olivaria]|uniref:enterochelin esterase n=1 Tax=Vreelandella olivaria TaxID=390919 RepID=UPI00201F835F|nr:enterochelin esterase [Halomonas olivaria]